MLRSLSPIIKQQRLHWPGTTPRETGSRSSTPHLTSSTNQLRTTHGEVKVATLTNLPSTGSSLRSREIQIRNAPDSVAQSIPSDDSGRLTAPAPIARVRRRLCRFA